MSSESNNTCDDKNCNHTIVEQNQNNDNNKKNISDNNNNDDHDSDDNDNNDDHDSDNKDDNDDHDSDDKDDNDDHDSDDKDDNDDHDNHDSDNINDSNKFYKKNILIEMILKSGLDIQIKYPVYVNEDPDKDELKEKYLPFSTCCCVIKSYLQLCSIKHDRWWYKDYDEHNRATKYILEELSCSESEMSLNGCEKCKNVFKLYTMLNEKIKKLPIQEQINLSIIYPRNNNGYEHFNEKNSSAKIILSPELDIEIKFPVYFGDISNEERKIQSSLKSEFWENDEIKTKKLPHFSKYCCCVIRSYLRTVIYDPEEFMDIILNHLSIPESDMSLRGCENCKKVFALFKALLEKNKKLQTQQVYIKMTFPDSWDAHGC